MPVTKGDLDGTVGVLPVDDMANDDEVDSIVMRLAVEKVSGAFNERSDDHAAAADRFWSTGVRDPLSFAPVDRPSETVEQWE